MVDLAKVFKDAKVKFVGIRHGEKVHEDLISRSESRYSMETKKYYILYPNINPKNLDRFKKKLKQEFKKDEFNYNSGTNKHF